MYFKKSRGVIYDVELNAAEKKAFDMSARRMLAEHTRKHTLELEAIIMRQVRRATGWGAIRMRRFYDGFDDDLYALIDHYEMTDLDAPWLCTRELKEEGFDIEQWHKERHPNEKYDNCVKKRKD